MVGWDWLGAPPGALESCGIEAKKMERPMRVGKDGLKAKAELLSLDHLQRDSSYHALPHLPVSARVPQHWTKPLDLDTLTLMPCILY